MNRARPDSGFRARIVLGVYVLCFAIGIFSHARDFWWVGWRPYGWAPPTLEAFWTSLVLLDAMVIVLIAAGRRRAALTLAVAIMIADVAANTYAWLALSIAAFAVAIPLQAAFLGFVLGSAPFVWSGDDSRARLKG